MDRVIFRDGKSIYARVVSYPSFWRVATPYQRRFQKRGCAKWERRLAREHVKEQSR